MKPIQTRDATHNFDKPNTWDNNRDGPCGILSVRVEPHGIHNYHVSTWQPDKYELRALNEGGAVVLTCVGIQPPVSVDVESYHDG